MLIKVCHIWGSSCFHILYLKSRQIKEQLLYSMDTIICTLGLSIIAFTGRSYSQNYSKSCSIAFTERRLFFFKKDKESIRILHISLKINVYLLQAAQCVFFFSLRRGNFIFKQWNACWMLGIFWMLNVFLPGKRRVEAQARILPCLAVGGSSVLRKKWMSSPGILLLVLFEGSTRLI